MEEHFTSGLVQSVRLRHLVRRAIWAIRWPIPRALRDGVGRRSSSRRGCWPSWSWKRRRVPRQPVMLNVNACNSSSARVDRRIQQARGQESGDVSERKPAGVSVKREFDRAQERALVKQSGATSAPNGAGCRDREAVPVSCRVPKTHNWHGVRC